MSEKESYDFLGFGISGYRSFTSDDPALVGPFGKIHLITGQNNSGKSALANVAYHALPSLRREGAIDWRKDPFGKEDLPQSMSQTASASLTLSLCFSRSSLLSQLVNSQLIGESSKDILKKLLQSPLVSRGNENVCWFGFDIPEHFIAFDLENSFSTSSLSKTSHMSFLMIMTFMRLTKIRRLASITSMLHIVSLPPTEGFGAAQSTLSAKQ